MFHSATSHEAPAGDGNIPPHIEYQVQGSRGQFLLAAPPGARIECEAENLESASVLIIDTRPVQAIVIANVTVRVPDGRSMTEEVAKIASALYWSWWRARYTRDEATR